MTLSIQDLNRVHRSLSDIVRSQVFGARGDVSDLFVVLAGLTAEAIRVTAEPGHEGYLVDRFLDLLADRMSNLRADRAPLPASPPIAIFTAENTGRFAQMLADVGVSLPLSSAPENAGVIIDAAGRELVTVDHEAERDVAEVEAIERLLIHAINTCGGFGETGPSSARVSS